MSSQIAPDQDIRQDIRACRLCAARFAATASAHVPRPVVWFQPDSASAARPRLLIAGQAPGARVHASGRPFTDPSGDRLRDWTALTAEQFYDMDRIAIVPMAFCFPGYDAKGADLPPPPVCAATWRTRVMAELPGLRLVLAVGGAAQRWHLGTRDVTSTTADWRRHLAEARVFPLPHPSWRNTAWLKRNPWFAAEAVPALRHEIRAALEERP